MKGHCLCGRVRYLAPDTPKWSALCHCESCRRSASAPVVAWMGFAVKDVLWEGERAFYQSSEIAKRGFCPNCGTQMSFESAQWPDEIHLYGVSRVDPENYTPQAHCHTGEHLAWLTITDDLPRYTRTADAL